MPKIVKGPGKLSTDLIPSHPKIASLSPSIINLGLESLIFINAHFILDLGSCLKRLDLIRAVNF